MLANDIGSVARTGFCFESVSTFEVVWGFDGLPLEIMALMDGQHLTCHPIYPFPTTGYPLPKYNRVLVRWLMRLVCWGDGRVKMVRCCKNIARLRLAWNLQLRVTTADMVMWSSCGTAEGRRDGDGHDHLSQIVVRSQSLDDQDVDFAQV